MSFTVPTNISFIQFHLFEKKCALYFVAGDLINKLYYEDVSVWLLSLDFILVEYINIDFEVHMLGA